MDELYRPLADTWAVYDGSTPGWPRRMGAGHRERVTDANPTGQAFAQRTPIDAAMTRAARRTLAVHKRLGQSVVAWREGKVVTLSPEEIPVGVEESEHPLSRPPADDADPVR